MLLTVLSNEDAAFAAMNRVMRNLADAAQGAMADVAPAVPSMMAATVMTQGLDAGPAEVSGLTEVQASSTQMSIVCRYAHRPMIRCNAQQVRGGVSVKLPGGRKVIPHAFIGQTRSGKTEVMIRDVKAGKVIVRRHGSSQWMAEPVLVLDGPTVAQVLGSPRGRQMLQVMVGSAISQQLARRVSRARGG